MAAAPHLVIRLVVAWLAVVSTNIVQAPKIENSDQALHPGSSDQALPLGLCDQAHLPGKPTWKQYPLHSCACTRVFNSNVHVQQKCKRPHVQEIPIRCCTNIRSSLLLLLILFCYLVRTRKLDQWTTEAPDHGRESKAVYGDKNEGSQQTNARGESQSSSTFYFL